MTRKQLIKETRDCLENDHDFDNYRLLPRRYLSKTRGDGTHQVIDDCSIKHDIGGAIETYLMNGSPILFLYI